MSDWKSRAILADNDNRQDWRSRAVPVDDETNRPQAPSRPAEAALEGFGQAATAGYLPQLQAALGGLIPRAGGDTDKELEKQGFTIKQPEDTYTSRRDEAIKRSEALAASNPYAHGAGMIGGAIASTPAYGAALGAARVPIQGIKGAVISGGLMGALQNPGDTQGDVSPLQLKERASGALSGAVVGGVTQAAAQGLAKAGDIIATLPERMKDYAELKAFKSAGPFKADIKRAMNQNRVNAIGEEMIKKGLVKPGASPESIGEAAGALKEKAGNIIGDVYATAKEQASNVAPLDFGQIGDEALAKIKKTLSGTAGGTRALGAVQDVVNELKNIGVENGERVANPNILDLQKFKSSLDSLINYNREISDQPLAKQALYSLRRNVSDAIDSHIGALDKALGSRSLESLKEANRQYGIWSEVEAITKNRTAAENVNRMFGLTDTIAGAGGGAIGAIAGAATGHNPEESAEHAIKGAGLGLLLGGVNKLSRHYGNPILTQGAYQAGKLGAMVPGRRLIQSGANIIGNAPMGLIAPRLMPKVKPPGGGAGVQ